MTKSDFKQLSETILVSKEDLPFVAWNPQADGDEFLTVDGGDIGVTVSDTEVRLHEGEPGFIRINLSNDEEIKIHLEHFEEEADAGYDKYPESMYPMIFSVNEEILKDFKTDLEQLIATKYQDKIVAVNLNV